jgi:MFS family permease
MILFSARFGRYASRYGPRWFMAAGPAIMALGVLWYMRFPATSAPWRLHLNDPSTFLPPLSYVTDLLPASIIFGIGLMAMVAPLTTAVMRSVPTHNAGLASSINNAISRVGPQLAGALVFVFITASFYGYIAARANVDVTSPQFRKLVSPLNPPGIPALATLVRDASVASFHLAMIVGAVLLVAGAIINAVGISNAAVVEEAPAQRPKIVVHAPSHSGPGVCCPDEEESA